MNVNESDIVISYYASSLFKNLLLDKTIGIPAEKSMLTIGLKQHRPREV